MYDTESGIAELEASTISTFFIYFKIMLAIIGILLLAIVITVFATGFSFLWDYDKLAMFFCYLGFVEFATLILVLLITLIQALS